jgi:hypothetical protein
MHSHAYLQGSAIVTMQQGSHEKKQHLYFSPATNESSQQSKADKLYYDNQPKSPLDVGNLYWDGLTLWG